MKAMTYIKPLTIGSLTLDTNIIQGPLAGYSCAPFRELVWQFGGVAYCCTEMQSSHSIAYQINQPQRYRYRGASERKLCVQLSGNNRDKLSRAADRVMDWGVDLVDLNCGCPQPKIRQKSSGSSLLSKPELLYTLIVGIKAVLDIPFTVKIRVDGKSGDNYNSEVVSAIAAAGADALIIHGRHWTERYDVPVRYDEIAALAKKVTIPVIANGDVASYSDLIYMMEQTACDGVMVARAGIGQPWIFKEWQHVAADLAFDPPNLAQIKQLFLYHIKGLIALDGEHRACLQARRLWDYYFKQQPLTADQQQQKNKLALLQDIETLLQSTFKDLV